MSDTEGTNAFEGGSDLSSPPHPGASEAPNSSPGSSNGGQGGTNSIKNENSRKALFVNWIFQRSFQIKTSRTTLWVNWIFPKDNNIFSYLESVLRKSYFNGIAPGAEVDDLRHLQRGHRQLSLELRRQRVLQLQGLLQEGHPEGQEPAVHMQERSVRA